ncbi:CBS domain-containing protein [Saccharopolyspora hirsuta]|uniref:Zinc metalloprotease n=1 Tax=Saccharopolyspora hirsuta TaxID=1837 RepID=A0A5M7CEH2_SACHI|nr:site-2 protease family protein [Saccharopolyspora hirsuta]KAA5838074.1 CBS domain-containing protein [Saccharopolyspora hirsuta]
MRDSVPVGRFAGVRVGLHWSVLGIVALVSAGLGGYVLPADFPGRAPVAYAVSGIIAALLLVCSVLAHEIAHAVVARRNGVAVEGITLWLLGGMARLRGEARTAGADFRIAAVGPATSFALALVFGAGGWAAAQLGADELVSAVLGYLAVLNAVLAVFNLVPAAPLDGGRVLRAALWAWRGDRFRAAVWSAWAGRGFGFLLIAAGIAEVLARSPGGLWWVLLGLFVVNMASAEEQQARIGVALAGITVGDVMSGPVDTAPAEQTVEQFFREAAVAHRHSTLPVLDEHGRPRGLVTLHDLREVPVQARSGTPLHQVARPLAELPVAEPGEPLALVLPRMTEAGRGRVLVCAGGELRGIISPSDIARVLADHRLSTTLPAGADLSWEPDARPPPPDWWFPGQQRPR